MKGSGGALGRSLVRDKNRRLDNVRRLRRAQELTNIATQRHKDKATVLGMDAPEERRFMGSVTHTTDLGELMEAAALANRSFAVEKENMVVLTKTAALLPPANPTTSKIAERAEAAVLAIPRRPAWHRGMDAATVDRQERESFLCWRRNLALAEERDNLLLTPYEKNLEIWRQLWRVVERSDAVVQVVDVRDPLFFCCQDLNRYIAEVSAAQGRATPKRTMLLLNKSDLLTEHQRIAWAKYLTAKGMDFVFFSALAENTRREAEDEARRAADAASRAREQHEPHLDADLDDEDRIAAAAISGNPILRNADAKEEEEEAKEETKEEEEETKEEEEEKKAEVTETAEKEEEKEKEEEELTEEEKKWREAARVLNSVELHDRFAAFADAAQQELQQRRAAEEEDKKKKQGTAATEDDELLEQQQQEQGERKKGRGKAKAKGKRLPMRHDPAPDGSVTIGMVGYPNVGKSSTINALCGEKRVAVTSQPGKTKHFQTIPLTPLVTLCDCPGLVFPTFLNSKAEMVCNGVLSIDQCTDYLSPVALICQRIPHAVLCARYAVAFTSDAEAAAAAQRADAQPLDTLTEDNEAQRFLSAIARTRGFMTQAHGSPDQSRAARLVVKDYLKGALFYAMPPPGVSPAEYVAWQGSGSTVEPILEAAATAAATAGATGAEAESFGSNGVAASGTGSVLAVSGKGHRKARGRKTRARAAAGMVGYDDTDDGVAAMGTVHTSGRGGSNDYVRTHWQHAPVPVALLRENMARRGGAVPDRGTRRDSDDYADE